MGGADSEKVKCAECGLLALRRGSGNDVPVEPVSEIVRSEGKAHVPGGYDAAPYCCLNEWRLHDEYKARTGGGEAKPGAFLSVITEPRVCPSFFEWTPAFTPKEHVEMLHTKMLREEIEARRVADEKRAEERKAADEKRAEERRVADKVESNNRRFNDRLWAWGQAGVIALLASGLTILAEPWKERAKQSVTPTSSQEPSVVSVATPTSPADKK